MAELGAPAELLRSASWRRQRPAPLGRSAPAPGSQKQIHRRAAAPNSPPATSTPSTCSPGIAELDLAVEKDQLGVGPIKGVWRDFPNAVNAAGCEKVEEVLSRLRR